MARQQSPIAVYLEVGQKKTFAGALDWPGWCRGAPDEAAALAALVEYAPRYAAIFSRTEIAFTPPDDPAAFAVAERLAGNGSTDFGVAFDRAAEAAEGKELRKGPRGGGRDRDRIVRHVLGADASYLRSLAQKFSQDDDAPLADELARTREAIRAALAAAARGMIPAQGPRGGKIWTPRYFVRRVAWHTVDHLWEIEDCLG